MLKLSVLFSSWAFLAAICAPVFATPPSTAVLHSYNANVNGKPVHRPVVLFNGDIIQTRTSAASIEFPGSAVLLDQNSTAVVQDNQLILICGGAVIRTLKGMTARSGNQVIKPASDSARFEAVRTYKSLRITAVDGNLIVSNGNQRIEVKKGLQIELICSECSQDASTVQNAGSSNISDSCTLPTVITPFPATNPSLFDKILAGVAPTSAIWPILADTPVSPDHP